MDKVILLLGDFTFLNREVDKETKTIINRIDSVILCSSEDSAEQIGEDLLDEYEGYLVPSSYSYPIEGLIIDEDTSIEFTQYSEITFNYLDDIEDEISYVLIYLNGKFVANMRIWYDSLMEDREYLTINHEIIYLDTLKQERF